ncbi:MAG: DUF1249 domain-containing protein [Gammaproteobacteria bacterium]|nr:DUF1249 domain-containing protein [Gammaproteobacteria bacterium]
MRCSNNFARIPHPDPNTFAGLMEVYENNYIKLRRLCGNFNALNEYSYSRVNNALDLHLQVVERTKYTITLNLTYRFTDKKTNQIKELPNLLIKVYFDAMQAEVLHRESKKSLVTQAKPSRLSNKWKDNRFLYKWLSFCIAQGHVFDAEMSRINCI